MLRFVITLPPKSAPDVAHRELDAWIAEGEMLSQSLGPDTIESAEFEGADNDPVHAELVDVDDAGNRSPASVLDAVLRDTLAPPTPGQLGVKIIAEV